MICWVKSLASSVSENKRTVEATVRRHTCLVHIARLRVMFKLLFAASLLQLSGCSSLGYYWQAVDGQMTIVSREQPIDKLLAKKTLSPDLRQKLELIEQARRFAATQLDLPVGDSYATYVDLQREFVTWNVIATPPYSVVPQQWCYLFAGCFNYRGYFHKQDAITFARALKKKGKDVAIAGALAYSTLGWFDDPVLNTMLDHDDTEVVGTLFHELGHKTVYVDNDSSFNESFANTVEQVGLQRWYQHMGKPEKFQAYLHRQAQRRQVIRLLERTRETLRQIYAESVDDKKKQVLKAHAFARLKQAYRHWRQQHDYAGFDAWMKQKLNNADLALIATYSDQIPAFRAMLASVQDKLPAFYRLVRKVGDMPPDKRKTVLAAYAKQARP